MLFDTLTTNEGKAVNLQIKKKICFHFSLQSTRNADKNASLDVCVYIRNDAKQQYCQSSRRFLWIYVNDYTKTSNLQLPCSLLQTAFSFLCKPYVVVIQQRKEVVEKNGLWVTLNFYLHLAKARRFLFFRLDITRSSVLRYKDLWLSSLFYARNWTSNPKLNFIRSTPTNHELRSRK